jgi:PAS domain S-box-containing protein
LFAVSLIEDEEGSPQGVTGLVLDISDRKSLEAALRAERDRLDAILRHIGDAVIVTNAEGEIEYVNPAWERLNGYAADEVIGQNLRLLQSGKQSPEFYAEMWSTILSGHTWRRELVNRRKDGSLYDAAVTIAPIQTADGMVANFVGVQVDISALKELDRMKSQFVSDVSHELRTPLTNIRLYLDLLTSGGDADRANRYLETLRRESERLTNLIDERLLSQVFTNLLTNAMNYTPSGGRIRLCSCARTDPSGSWVTVDVDDTGLGIPVEEQTLLFRRFFRGRASRETRAPGTGLGLAICKEILDRHDGRVSVESQGRPGRGTRFTVWLRPFGAPQDI